MNTKILSLVLGLGAILTLFSCEKEKGISTVENPNLIVRLSVNGASSKTQGTTVEDLSSEATISSVRLFMINPSDLDEIEEIASDAYTFTASTNTIAARLSFRKEGDWLLYVIANWPAGLTLDTDSYEGFVGSYSGLTATQLGQLWDDNSFLMVNAQNAETEDDVDKAGVPVNLNNLADDAESPQIVNVNLERVAAKVVVNTSSTNYSLIGTTMGGYTAVFGVSKVEIDKVALVNRVDSFNLVQQWDGSGNLVTPSSASDFSGYFNPVSSSVTFEDPNTPIYCLENNSAEYDKSQSGANPDATDGTKYKGRVTGIILRAKVTTLSTYSSEAEVDDGGNEGEYLVQDPTPGEWDTKAGTSDAEQRTLYKYNGTMYADSQILFDQNPSLGYAVDATPSTTELRAKGVSVFENGTMYYTYWIEDPNYGCLAVFRNTFYNIIVDSVSAFGDDVPGGRGYSAAAPIETEAPKISVSMTIADWDEKEEANYTL